MEPKSLAQPSFLLASLQWAGPKMAAHNPGRKSHKDYTILYLWINRPFNLFTCVIEREKCRVDPEPAMLLLSPVVIDFIKLKLVCFKSLIW